MKRLLIVGILIGSNISIARPVDRCHQFIEAAKQALHDSEIVRGEILATQRDMHKTHERAIQALVNYLECKENQ